MELNRKLLLNRYFLHLFGFEDFSEIKEKLKDTNYGPDAEGKSYFADTIIGWSTLKIPLADILTYDQAIKDYWGKLSTNRRADITPKYFQYLALLFTEIFLNKYFNHRAEFLAELNSFVDTVNQEITRQSEKFSYFNEADLSKLAFWMATGSGKTLIMHINYWQFLKYQAGKLDNIILVTPNEGLSRQHCNEMERSGVPCKLYSQNSHGVTLFQDEVLVIDIHKLTEEKKGAGVRVEVDYFEGKNLVFIDEGHKGQATEEKTWKRLREGLGKYGFIFEYSATFQQVIGPRNKDLLEEYSKAIVFDYSYKHFYSDGYGKDFYVYNLSEKSFQEKFRDVILTGNLLSFYEQNLLFDSHQDELREYQIEKPLWAFIGSRVTGAGINSDVLKVVQFLEAVIEDTSLLKKNIEEILNGESGLIDREGNDIFQNRFQYIRKSGFSIDDIYGKVFSSKAGSLCLYEIKFVEGEIGLRIGDGDYFGVINIGDVAAFKKLLHESGLEVKADNVTPSLFERINEPYSNVNILIGAKKFIEGWDSWRVSSMGLINMGRGEGAQIIQLFGRGVRLKGRDFSLKRSGENKYQVRGLETLNIFGLNADYVNTFLETIRREEVEYEEIGLPVKLMDEKEKWRSLYMLQTPKDFDFSKHFIKLEADKNLLSKVKIDITPRIRLAHGLETERAELLENKAHIGGEYLDLLNWDEIYLDVLRYRTLRGYSNLSIDKDILLGIVKDNGYELYAFPEQITPRRFDDLSKLQEVIMMILKNFVDRVYNFKLKQEETKRLKPTYLTRGDENLAYGSYTLKIPMDRKKEIKKIRKLLKQANKLYQDDLAEIPTIHFDRHLYTPLVVYGKRKDFVKSVPQKLNEGETKFISKLREYVRTNSAKFNDKEVFLLRNLSQRGVRFFQTSGFYPDFIMWIRSEDKQTMVFIDPKGIRNSGNFSDEKIQLHSSIKDIEAKINTPGLNLESYILSVSNYKDVNKMFDDGKRTKQEFEDNHILFMEDADLIKKLFQRLS
jgi:hypothetical protein